MAQQVWPLRRTRTQDESVALDSQTFAQLYDTYLSKVYNFMRYRVGDDAVAEDLTAQTFERALREWRRYSPQRGAFSTWLFTIARRVAINHWHAQRRRPTVALAAVVDELPLVAAPDATVEEEMAWRELHAALARLPEIDQELIALKFAADMTNREIAQVTRLSESNVGTRLHRALRQLRQILEETQP
jgi:RNA polymerase sigma-70 factor (ECF subfamily)